MKSIKFNEYYKKNKYKFIKKRLILKNIRGFKLRKTRKKSKEEWEIIFIMALNRFKKAIESKELEIIDKKKLRLKILK
jgi:hypothetical protein